MRGKRLEAAGWGGLLGLLVLAAVLLYGLRNAVLAPWPIAQLEDVARTSWGIELHIGAVRGSWLFDLEAVDLRLQADPPQGPAVAAEADASASGTARWPCFPGTAWRTFSPRPKSSSRV